jgi:hypothetical protein
MRIVQRLFTAVCAAVGVVLGLLGYALVVALTGLEASGDGVLLAIVGGGLLLALASRTVLARALGVRTLWIATRLLVRRFGLPL